MQPTAHGHTLSTAHGLLLSHEEAGHRHRLLPHSVATSTGWALSPGGRTALQNAWPTRPLSKSECPASSPCRVGGPKGAGGTAREVRAAGPVPQPRRLQARPAPTASFGQPHQAGLSPPPCMAAPAHSPPASQSQGPLSPRSCCSTPCCLATHSAGRVSGDVQLHVSRHSRVRATRESAVGPPNTPPLRLQAPRGPHLPRSWMASSNLFSSMAFCTSFV